MPNNLQKELEHLQGSEGKLAAITSPTPAIGRTL